MSAISSRKTTSVKNVVTDAGLSGPLRQNTTKKHQLGNLELVDRWQLSDTEQGVQCVPVKPGLFPSQPLSLKKGVLARLA